MHNLVWYGRNKMNPSIVQQFLRRVDRRNGVVTFARRWRTILLVTLGIYALALLISRLLGVLPGWFSPLSLVVTLVGAAALAWVSHRRTNLSDAARLADSHLGSHDLFLTASEIEHCLGGYQDLVLRDAEHQAASVSPKNVVPYHWQRDTFRMAGAVAVLVFGIYLLPQWDPFGFHHRQKQVAEQRERIRELNKAAEARISLLEQKRSGEQADVVKQAIANLEKAFQEAKPNDQAGTLAKMTEQQKILGRIWKAAGEEKLKNGLNLPPPTQGFGMADSAKSAQLRNDLQKGDVSSANKELNELKKMAQELAAAKDPVAREKLRQELMDRLQNLKDTLDQQLNSQALDSDLQRALEQLAMANTPELSGESLSGLGDSLKLTQEELQQLAQALSNMNDLEEALRVLQMAKALQSLKPLDGQDCAGFSDLAAYAAFFESQCQALGAGMCFGMGGKGGGHGIGSDETTKTDFQSEKSASPLQPGRMLMEWKTREVSDAGPAREEYLRAVADVRQRASEAVVSEQIPPRYQAAIKNYFDTLHNDTRAKTQP
jgi:tetratricopeptide (TPR) repeat protein